jgi:hypothetical protein
MIFDALVSFVPNGFPLSLVAGAGIAIPSTNIIDLIGSGVGTAPPNIIGTRSVFGTDMGVGGLRPELNVTIGTALAGAAGLTLKAALQAAQDPGAAGNYTPTSWIDIDSQDGISIANGIAGAVIFRSPWIPTMPPGFMPRFLRMLFSPVSAGGAVPSGAFTAGTIASALVTMIRDDQSNRFSAKNYTVA